MGLVTTKNDSMQACIDACVKSSQACFECFDACLNEPDIGARKNCIAMLVECAMSCQMSVAMMSMSGKFSKEHCKMCADICEMCAKECDMFKDDHCIKCAQICRECATECKKMAV